MHKQGNKMAELLEEYPELGVGLGQLIDQDQDGVVGMVGILSILQMRLRSVLCLLPQLAASEDEATAPGEGGSNQQTQFE